MEQAHHHFHDLLFEGEEAGKLRHLDVHDHLTKFVENELDALKGRGLQTVNLLLGEHFEGHFGHEEIRAERTRIPDSSLDVIVGQGIKRIDVVDSLVEHLKEDVIESTASLQLDRSIFHKFAIQKLSISSRIFSNNVEN